ncbi:MAG TPA: hypothetical protein VEI96_09290 [Thermodesulfovibrionales bacterium]|nr:hypothetical protein [Thermodesulfovibrionales bacterium]
MIVFLIVVAGVAYGGGMGVIPYGDYCQYCSAYGICKGDLEPREAEKAIEGYFGSKGLRVVHIRHRERFVEVEIYKDNKMVDKILFDRKTGRIRSTY